MFLRFEFFAAKWSIPTLPSLSRHCASGTNAGAKNNNKLLASVFWLAESSQPYGLCPEQSLNRGLISYDTLTTRTIMMMTRYAQQYSYTAISKTIDLATNKCLQSGFESRSRKQPYAVTVLEARLRSRYYKIFACASHVHMRATAAAQLFAEPETQTDRELFATRLAVCPHKR